MTTSTPTISLDRVGEALVNARDALVANPGNQAVEDALVHLCRAAYDTLVAWELMSTDPDPVPVPREEPRSWRTSLDYLRVQAALAEMELRDAGTPGLQTADRLVRTVSERLTYGRQEIGDALHTLRAELRRLAP